MIKTFQIKTRVEGKVVKFNFNCYSKHDRMGTTEVCELEVNGECYYRRSEGRDRWLNRPWYEYQYQNAMRHAVYNLKEQVEQLELERYKERNNLKRLSDKHKKEAMREIKRLPLYRAYIRVIKDKLKYDNCHF